MNLPLRIAFRYLFARKSFNVINMISGIAVAGMALGTAALIIILSVFNGFNRLVSDSLSKADPDLVIRPSVGKVFIPEGPAFDWAYACEDVKSMSSVLEEQVFVSYEGRQRLARVKGLDLVAQEESPLKDNIIDGQWALHKGSLPQAVLGSSLAYSLGLSPRFVASLEIYYPSRTKRISAANPAASLRSVSMRPSGLVSVNADIDASLILVPIESMRELLEYPDEVSSLEIRTAPGSVKKVQKELQKRLGEDFTVLDRFQQEASLYKMMRYEKLAIYLILVFVVLLVAINIYLSLKMLIIEKQEDITTYRSLGASESLIRRIFRCEGMLVALLGLGIGLILGIALVLIQDRFGLVGMPGNFIVQAYPVVLKFTDILYTATGVGLIGLAMAWIPSRKI